MKYQHATIQIYVLDVTKGPSASFLHSIPLPTGPVTQLSLPQTSGTGLLFMAHGDRVTVMCLEPLGCEKRMAVRAEFTAQTPDVSLNNISD